MQKRFVSFVAIILALTFSILACQISFSTAKVENLRMARDEEGNQPTTQFDPQDIFYLVGELANAPDDTRLKAVWIAVDVEGVAANSEIQTYETTSGSGKFWVRLSRDAGPWPAGKYKVDLYLNDELNQSLAFEVKASQVSLPSPAPTEAAPAPPSGAAGLSNIHTSLDEADARPSSQFAQADTIYTHFNLDAPQGSAQINGTLTAVSAEGVEPETVFTELNESFPAGVQWIRFTNTMPWPKGVYRIDLTVDGEPAQPLEVEVVSTNTSGAQIQNVYTSLDQNGDQAATVFPTTGSIYVQFSLTAPGSEVEVRGVMVAQVVQDVEPNSHVTEAGGALASGSYWFEYFNDGPWPVGKYVVYIYLDGEFVQQVEVNVQ
jgi:hypothetical protein